MLQNTFLQHEKYCPIHGKILTLQRVVPSPQRGLKKSRDVVVCTLNIGN